MMRKIRTVIGRMLVFHTRALPKRIGIPVRRMGRKILFSNKQMFGKAAKPNCCGPAQLH